MKPLDKKAEGLRTLMRSMKSVAVAFSGGADSALVARIAKDELGAAALAVTVDSPLYTSSELKAAKALAKKIGIEHVVIRSEPLDDRRFVANPTDRCYLCKHEDLTLIREIANRRGIKQVVDGTNADDKRDYRPGTKAKAELGVRSPLAEAGFTKPDVRNLSKAMLMPTAKKSASACLASRIPYGEMITAKKLVMIEKGEEFLNDMGFDGVRVRIHGPIARIEVRPQDLSKLSSAKVRSRVLRRFKALGFTYVTMDLEGYRTGSMNEVLNL